MITSRLGCNYKTNIILKNQDNLKWNAEYNVISAKNKTSAKSQNALDTPRKGDQWVVHWMGKVIAQNNNAKGKFYRLGLGYVLRTKEFPLTATPKG